MYKIKIWFNHIKLQNLPSMEWTYYDMFRKATWALAKAAQQTAPELGEISLYNIRRYISVPSKQDHDTLVRKDSSLNMETKCGPTSILIAFIKDENKTHTRKQLALLIPLDGINFGSREGNLNCAVKKIEDSDCSCNTLTYNSIFL